MSESYYAHPYKSNSDLTKIKNATLAPKEIRVFDAALRRGSLLDNYLLWGNDRFMEMHPTPEEIRQVKKMARSYYNHPWCQIVHGKASKQVEFYESNHKFDVDGFIFYMDIKCLFDYFFHAACFGGDLKRTAARSQKEFEDHCIMFEYTRSRAWYMDIAKSDKDFIIGVNEHGEIFTVWINRGDNFYNTGRDQYNDLALKQYMLL